jgi:predicted MFS family arabinose efflux permease
VGYTVGLVLGGVFIQAAGWRAAFYFAAGLNVLIFVSAVWGLPSDEKVERAGIWGRMKREIDWVGAVIAKVSISLLSYVMA